MERVEAVRNGTVGAVRYEMVGYGTDGDSVEWDGTGQNGKGRYGVGVEVGGT